jgi:hypothetical protein
MNCSRLLHWAEANFITKDFLSVAMEEPNLRTSILIKNALSAYIFLITWFLSEQNKIKETKEVNISKNKRKVAKKDRTENECE